MSIDTAKVVRKGDFTGQRFDSFLEPPIRPLSYVTYCWVIDLENMLHMEMSILTLPNELLISLIEHTDGPSRAALARTCRALNLLITPYLYESVNIQLDKSNEFVRTIKTRYADLVRHVTVAARDHNLDISPCRIVPCLDKLENMQSLTLAGGYWMWDTDEENWDTLEDYLWDYLGKASLKQPVESRVATNLRSRKSLTSTKRNWKRTKIQLPVTLDRSERNGQAAFLHCSSIFIIPQLHDLTIRGFMLEEEDTDIKPQFERQTELKSLRIEKSFVNFMALKKALLAPRALRYLGIGHAEYFWHHELKNAEDNHATVAEFVGALLPHRDTLEEIKVIVDYDGCREQTLTANASSFRKHATQFPVLKRWLGCDKTTLAHYLNSDEPSLFDEDREDNE